MVSDFDHRILMINALCQHYSVFIGAIIVIKRLFVDFTDFTSDTMTSLENYGLFLWCLWVIIEWGNTFDDLIELGLDF